MMATKTITQHTSNQEITMQSPCLSRSSVTREIQSEPIKHLEKMLPIQIQMNRRSIENTKEKFHPMLVCPSLFLHLINQHPLIIPQSKWVPLCSNLPFGQLLLAEQQVFIFVWYRCPLRAPINASFFGTRRNNQRRGTFMRMQQKCFFSNSL